MAKMHITPYTIYFPDEPLIDTTELLEELSISYASLYSRIRQSGNLVKKAWISCE